MSEQRECNCKDMSSTGTMVNGRCVRVQCNICKNWKEFGKMKSHIIMHAGLVYRRKSRYEFKFPFTYGLI